MPFTVVSFHAHPDDEAILVAGTLARAAAEGHRVVLVTATDGGAGLASAALTPRATGTDPTPGTPGTDSTPGTDPTPRTPGTPVTDLATRRLEELRAAAASIGCRDVRLLGYHDSGIDGRAAAAGQAFATADVDEAASRLAAILTETGADVLTVYDPAGGYGHPDHVQVHRVGGRAAQLSGTPVVLEATVDRRPLVRILRIAGRTGIVRLLGVNREEWSSDRFARAFADPDRITHKVNVRRYSGAKRAAMAAHVSQATADTGVRTLAAFLRFPPSLFQRVFGHEWFVEQGRSPEAEPLDDIFASVRSSAGGGGTLEAGPG